MSAESTGSRVPTEPFVTKCCEPIKSRPPGWDGTVQKPFFLEKFFVFIILNNFLVGRAPDLIFFPQRRNFVLFPAILNRLQVHCAIKRDVFKISGKSRSSGNSKQSIDGDPFGCPKDSKILKTSKQGVRTDERSDILFFIIGS